jgi:hypothetical protein
MYQITDNSSLESVIQCKMRNTNLNIIMRPDNMQKKDKTDFFKDLELQLLYKVQK